MPNPRKDVAFDGINYQAETFRTDGVTITYDSTQANGSAHAGDTGGKAVTFSADETVALANAGDVVVGKLIKVEADGMATIQTLGYTTLPAGDGGVPVTRGQKIVGATNGGNRGYVRAVPVAGATYSQTDQQSIANGRHEIVDNSVTTALVINLGK